MDDPVAIREHTCPEKSAAFRQNPAVLRSRRHIRLMSRRTRDWSLARTKKQIVETAARMWAGIERP